MCGVIWLTSLCFLFFLLTADISEKSVTGNIQDLSKSSFESMNEQNQKRFSMGLPWPLFCLYTFHAKVPQKVA